MLYGMIGVIQIEWALLYSGNSVIQVRWRVVIHEQVGSVEDS